MNAIRRLAPALLAAAVLGPVTGCAGDQAPAGGDAAGACLSGATDCADVPTGTGGPVSGPDGSLSLAEAVEAGVEGPFAVRAYYLAEGSTERLCEALAESYPPQCGEPSLLLDNAAGLDPGPLESEGDVTWSAQPVVLTGEIVDGSFVTR